MQKYYICYQNIMQSKDEGKKNLINKALLQEMGRADFRRGGY